MSVQPPPDDDLDPEVDASLADLEAKFKRAHSWFRRATMGGTLMLGVLAVLEEILVVATPSPLVLRFRDVVMVGGLAVLGLVAYWGCTRAYQALLEHDTLLMQSLRERAVMEKTIKACAPLLQAIKEAHGRGAALVIPPPTGGEAPPLKEVLH